MVIPKLALLQPQGIIGVFKTGVVGSNLLIEGVLNSAFTGNNIIITAMGPATGIHMVIKIAVGITNRCSGDSVGCS